MTNRKYTQNKSYTVYPHFLKMKVRYIVFVTMVTRSSPRYERLSPRSGSMTLSRACSAGGKDQTEWCLRSVLTRRGTGTWCFGSGCVSIWSFYLLFMAKKVNASVRRPFYCLRHKNVTAKHIVYKMLVPLQEKKGFIAGNFSRDFRKRPQFL